MSHTSLGPELRFVFLNFPLEQMRPYTRLAAEAAEAAGAQGRLWEMHDALYEDQGALSWADLIQRAETLGLDVPRFTHAVERRAPAARIDEDLRSGAYGGVNGTPTFFINGYRHAGASDPESLLAAPI